MDVSQAETLYNVAKLFNWILSFKPLWKFLCLPFFFQISPIWQELNSAARSKLQFPDNHMLMAMDLIIVIGGHWYMQLSQLWRDIRRKQSYYFYYLLTSDIEHLIDLSDHKFPIMCVVGDNVGRNVPMITIEWGWWWSLFQIMTTMEAWWCSPQCKIDDHSMWTLSFLK